MIIEFLFELANSIIENLWCEKDIRDRLVFDECDVILA